MNNNNNNNNNDISVNDAVLDPNASKQVAMTSLEWCARSRQLSLLNAVLSAHFSSSSSSAISDLQPECSLVLRHAVTSGCRDTLTSLLRHVDDSFLQQRHEGEGGKGGGGGGGGGGAGGGGDVSGREAGICRTRVDRLLGLSVECGHRDVTEVLLQRGADADTKYRGKPLLHLALSLGHQQVASLLVDHGADVNMIDSKGETPLFAAVSSDGEDGINIVNKLIDRGADVNHRSMTGRQPIHSAALSAAGSSAQILARLAQAGCDVGARDAVLGDTPLHLACARCNREAVTSLVQHGADFNGGNERGHTPLRKLLELASSSTRSRDFHQRSRVSLARALVRVGFRLQEPSSSSSNPSAPISDPSPSSSASSFPSLRSPSASSTSPSSPSPSASSSSPSPSASPYLLSPSAPSSFSIPPSSSTSGESLRSGDDQDKNHHHHHHHHHDYRSSPSTQHRYDTQFCKKTSSSSSYYYSDSSSSASSHHHHSSSKRHSKTQMETQSSSSSFSSSCTKDLNDTLTNLKEVDASSSTRTSTTSSHPDAGGTRRRTRRDGGGGGRGGRRDKTWELYQSLLSERKRTGKGEKGAGATVAPPPSLQHWCRMVIRSRVSKVRFQEKVKKGLEVSSHLHQYLMFLPHLVEVDDDDDDDDNLV
ncbi:uncharacterized protein LOC143289674 [Babylonia areolata]|uniref:uncharacterized protein LOC143289674 n=1 Tax=Babylonia areolata TaxID=304850 RepID=UPI003FD04BFD